MRFQQFKHPNAEVIQEVILKDSMVSIWGFSCPFGSDPIWVSVGIGVVLVVILVWYFAGRGKKGGRGRQSRNDSYRGSGRSDLIEIYVGNLSYDLSESQLRREFEKYGMVASARVIENRYNKKSKGFGFVEMPIRAEAEKAIRALHDKEVLGRKMRVNEARNKTRD